MRLASAAAALKLSLMKIPAALGLMVALASSIGLAQTSTTVPATPKPAAKSGTTKTAPAKKEEPIPKIEGIVINRSNGGFLGFQFVGNNIVLWFHDAKKKKMPVDVSRGFVRWRMKFQPGDDRAVLTLGSDGKSLTSTKVIPPPHNLKFFLSLYKEGQDDPVESYVVDYRD